jgi:hypothetical protein
LQQGSPATTDITISEPWTIASLGSGYYSIQNSGGQYLNFGLGFDNAFNYGADDWFISSAGGGTYYIQRPGYPASLAYLIQQGVSPGPAAFGSASSQYNAWTLTLP